MRSTSNNFIRKKDFLEVILFRVPQPALRFLVKDVQFFLFKKAKNSYSSEYGNSMTFISSLIKLNHPMLITIDGEGCQRY